MLHFHLTEEEGTTFLSVLANRHQTRHSRIRGDLVINGVPAQPNKLEGRVSYVQQDCTFSPDMSVRQTLLFTSLLKEPGNPSRGFDTKGRVRGRSCLSDYYQVMVEKRTQKCCGAGTFVFSTDQCLDRRSRSWTDEAHQGKTLDIVREKATQRSLSSPLGHR